MTTPASVSDVVVVSNRLPVDHSDDPAEPWRRSPGGLVTALEPFMRTIDGAWVGWPGRADLQIAPFDFDGMRLVPVTLTGEDIELYYEGFSNDTIWPLYHDVIAPPGYHREWWEAYVRVNRRFAETLTPMLRQGDRIWVHDYHLLSLPGALREMVIMRVAVLNNAPYEADQHAPIALKEGMTQAQLDDLNNWQNSSLFSDKERAVLAYTDAMTRNVQVPDDVFNAVKPHFDNKELVELTATIATYNMVSRFLEALEIHSHDER